MNILTFDIEDWWVYKNFSLGNSIDYIPRLDGYLDKILDKLDNKKVTATFFCLAIMAEEFPHVIRKISDRGHQIGCHSYSHNFFGNTTYQDFAEDTYKALDILNNIIGKKVEVYRAPAFSITEENKWAFEILHANGILFDCSIFPAVRSFGGFPSFPIDFPSRIHYNGIEIKEFPVSVTKIIGKKIAYSGGGYFRLFPYWKIKSIMKHSKYVMTYFHIKDFDKDQIRHFCSFQNENAVSRYFKEYYGLDDTFNKFSRLLDEWDFINIEQANSIIDWSNTNVIEL